MFDLLFPGDGSNLVIVASVAAWRRHWSDTRGNGAARDKMKDPSYLTLSDSRDCTAVSQYGHDLSVSKNRL